MSHNAQMKTGFTDMCDVIVSHLWSSQMHFSSAQKNKSQLSHSENPHECAGYPGVHVPHLH